MKRYTVGIGEADQFMNLGRHLREQGVRAGDDVDAVIAWAITTKLIPFRGTAKIVSITPAYLGAQGEVPYLDFYNEALARNFLPMPLEVCLKARLVVPPNGGTYDCGMEPVSDESGQDFRLTYFSHEGVRYIGVATSGMYYNDYDISPETQALFMEP